MERICSTVSYLLNLYVVMQSFSIQGKVIRSPEMLLNKQGIDQTLVDIEESKTTDLIGKESSNDDLKLIYHQRRYQRILRSLKNTTTTKNRLGSTDVNKSTNVPELLIKTLKPFSIRLFTTLPELASYCPGMIYSCSNECSNNTEFVRYSSSRGTSARKCNCDPACNDIFMDCCSDFAKECLKPSSKAKFEETTDDFYFHKSSWRCEDNFSIFPPYGCQNKPGIWMIAQCPHHWQNDDIRRHCHEPSANLSAQSYLRFLPVVGSQDKLTYRNQYCALCNDVSQYDFWTLIFSNNAIPPPSYTPDKFVEFLSTNLHHFQGVQPIEGQKLRWCGYPRVVGTCPKETMSAGALDACINGTVGLVEGDGKVFRNKGCALCNGVELTCGVNRPYQHCIQGIDISRAIRLRDYGVSLETKSCALDHVYDLYLGKCRQRYELSELENDVIDRYQVVLSLLKIEHNVFFYFEWGLTRSVIADYFKMNESQISIKDIKPNLIGSSEIPITFNVYLTPSQSLFLASNSELRGNSNETIGLRRLFKFHEPFRLTFFGRTFTVFRLRVRQIACSHRNVYRYGEYEILGDLRIRISSTGAIYDEVDYFLNTSVSKPRVEVCLKMLPLRCNGSYIKLNTSEYDLSPNLTVVYHSQTYKFGDYFYDNGTVLICVPFERNYTTSRRKAPEDNLALTVITWVGFILSIVGLLALFTTYAVFKELRTLPGKNVMSLAISLSLAEILWLCGSSLTLNEDACRIIAVINHYFFLVFFVASSAIAFHSCLVFGRKITFRPSKSEENKTFLIYSLVVWCIPAMFVLLFALLDHYEEFVVDYGKSNICWLGTKESKLFLFILPFGLLLLFNLFLFVFVAVRLYINEKSSAVALGKSADKPNVKSILICLKLSTLMAFSWLFGLLQVAVETETAVLAYFFVIFVSFQGVFICVAFLFKRACYELYSSLLSKSFSSSTTSGSASASGQGRPSNKNSSANIEETAF